jgi:hypothetical protein
MVLSVGDAGGVTVAEVVASYVLFEGVNVPVIVSARCEIVAVVVAVVFAL